MSAKIKKKTSARRIGPAAPREPTHNEIAICALSIWEAEGRPQGRDLEHWLQAETQLRQQDLAEAEA